MAAEKGKADGAGVPGHGGDGAEVAEELTQVVVYAAAIDVAKGSGMVCTRVPGSFIPFPARTACGRRCGGWKPPAGR